MNVSWRHAKCISKDAAAFGDLEATLKDLDGWAVRHRVLRAQHATELANDKRVELCALLDFSTPKLALAVD
eukprot:182665-Prymnesium_polylepis.1